jgi:hypothetical protein
MKPKHGARVNIEVWLTPCKVTQCRHHIMPLATAAAQTENKHRRDRRNSRDTRDSLLQLADDAFYPTGSAMKYHRATRVKKRLHAPLCRVSAELPRSTRTLGTCMFVSLTAGEHDSFVDHKFWKLLRTSTALTVSRQGPRGA